MILAVSSVYAGCYDDDDGINYKQKGFCKDTNGTQGNDFCMKNGNLVEYYCHLGSCKAQWKICSECEDGVCLSKEADDIINVNKPPVVNLFAMTAPGKTEVAFKIEVSDPEKEMVVYTLELGDGNKISNQENVVHDYGKTGNFTVTITARDMSGGTTTSSKEVAVEQEKMIEEKPKEEKIEDGTVKKGFFKKIIDWFKGLFGKD